MTSWRVGRGARAMYRSCLSRPDAKPLLKCSAPNNVCFRDRIVMTTEPLGQTDGETMVVERTVLCGDAAVVPLPLEGAGVARDHSRADATVHRRYKRRLRTCTPQTIQTLKLGLARGTEVTQLCYRRPSSPWRRCDGYPPPAATSAGPQPGCCPATTSQPSALSAFGTEPDGPELKPAGGSLTQTQREGVETSVSQACRPM